MPRQNVVIAIIVICLFVVLAIVGWGIYAIQNKVSIFAKKEEIPDEEE
jgi:ascorbate-specific PTS system EIIC-type component UlaA